MSKIAEKTLPAFAELPRMPAPEPEATADPAPTPKKKKIERVGLYVPMHMREQIRALAYNRRVKEHVIWEEMATEYCLKRGLKPWHLDESKK